MKDLRCMSYVGKGLGTIIAAGCQNVMLKIGVDNGKIIDEV